MPSREIVLASASPRRADLLRGLGFRIVVIPAHVDETRLPGEAPETMAERLARAKVSTVRNLSSPAMAIAADTIVVIEGEVLGKPQDRHEACRMLRRLAGSTHEVITAMAIRLTPEENLHCERTSSRVTFAPLRDEEIAWYAKTGEGLDKAGAYALQGIGALFVTSIQGSYTNVIGLPLERLYPHLRRWNCLPER